MPPGSVKVSDKRDGCRRQPHRFHVSQPPTQALDPLLAFVGSFHYLVFLQQNYPQRLKLHINVHVSPCIGR